MRLLFIIGLLIMSGCAQQISLTSVMPQDWQQYGQEQALLGYEKLSVQQLQSSTTIDFTEDLYQPILTAMKKVVSNTVNKTQASWESEGKCIVAFVMISNQLFEPGITMAKLLVAATAISSFTLSPSKKLSNLESFFMYSASVIST